MTAVLHHCSPKGAGEEGAWPKRGSFPKLPKGPMVGRPPPHHPAVLETGPRPPADRTPCQPQQCSWALSAAPCLAARVSCRLFADMINKQDCKYGDSCTFAYHQEEIDVWTEERKGTLNRDLLFDPLGGVKRGSLTIAKLLKEHQGIFTFLCEVPAPPSTVLAQMELGKGAPWCTAL